MPAATFCGYDYWRGTVVASGSMSAASRMGGMGYRSPPVTCLCFSFPCKILVLQSSIGYRSFIGTLLLDYNHSNPCMLTFVYVLHRAVSDRMEAEGQQQLSGSDTVSSVKIL